MFLDLLNPRILKWIFKQPRLIIFLIIIENTELEDTKLNFFIPLGHFLPREIHSKIWPLELLIEKKVLFFVNDIKTIIIFIYSHSNAPFFHS